MKKHVISLVLTILMGSLMMVSCSKDDIKPEDYATQILGTWNVVLDQSFESYTEAGLTDIEYFNEWGTAVSLTFKDNGKLTYHSVVNGGEDEWDDSYSIKGDTIIWDTKSYEILRFTTSQLIIESNIEDHRTNAGGEEVVTRLTKHIEMTR